MKVTMDAAGRIVIPKPIRELARLQAGSSLELTFSGGAIVLEPSPLEVEIVVDAGLWVARPTGPLEPLKSSTVQATLDSLRGGGD